MFYGQKPNHLNLNIYPNPVTEILYLQSSAEIEGIEIRDIMGRLVQKHTGTLNKIPVQALVPARYFIYIHTKDNIEIASFIKL